MKKMFLRTVSLFLIIIIAAFAVSCRNNNDNNSDQPDIEKTLTDHFNDMYELFNSKQFEQYVKYFDDDEATSQGRLNLFANNAIYYNTKLTLESVSVTSDDNGTVTANIVSLTETTEIATEATRIIRDTITYTLTLKDGTYLISTAIPINSEVVSAPSADYVTTAPQDTAAPETSA